MMNDSITNDQDISIKIKELEESEKNIKFYENQIKNIAKQAVENIDLSTKHIQIQKKIDEIEKCLMEEESLIVCYNDALDKTKQKDLEEQKINNRLNSKFDNLKESIDQINSRLNIKMNQL